MGNKISFINNSPEKVHIALKQVGVLYFENDVPAKGGKITFEPGNVWFTIEVRIGENRYELSRDGIMPILKSVGFAIVLVAEIAGAVSEKGTFGKLKATTKVASTLGTANDIPAPEAPYVYERERVRMNTDKTYVINRRDDGEWTVTKIVNLCLNGHSNPTGNSYCGTCGAKLDEPARTVFEYKRS